MWRTEWFGFPKENRELTFVITTTLHAQTNGIRFLFVRVCVCVFFVIVNSLWKLHKHRKIIFVLPIPRQRIQWRIFAEYQWKFHVTHTSVRHNQCSYLFSNWMHGIIIKFSIHTIWKTGRIWKDRKIRSRQECRVVKCKSLNQTLHKCMSHRISCLVENRAKC